MIVRVEQGFQVIDDDVFVLVIYNSRSQDNRRGGVGSSVLTKSLDPKGIGRGDRLTRIPHLAGSIRTAYVVRNLNHRVLLKLVGRQNLSLIISGLGSSRL